MNPELPPNPRAELEARVTAYLLGELPPHDAAALRRALDEDAELAALCERLRPTIKLVREASATATQPTAASSAPLKLSEERRQKLLAQFKTVAPKEFKPSARSKQYRLFGKYSRLVEIAACVAFLAVLTGLLLPSLARVKTKSVSINVRSNLRQIEMAKQMWADDNKASSDATPTAKDLEPYLNGSPHAVAGEKYLIGKVGETPVAEIDSADAKKAFGRSADGKFHLFGDGGRQARMDVEGNVTLADNSTSLGSRPALTKEIPTVGTLAGALIIKPGESLAASANTAGKTTIVLPSANQLADSAAPVADDLQEKEKSDLGLSSANSAAGRRAGLAWNYNPANNQPSSDIASSNSIAAFIPEQELQFGANVHPAPGLPATPAQPPALAESALATGLSAGGAAPVFPAQDRVDSIPAWRTNEVRIATTVLDGKLLMEAGRLDEAEEKLNRAYTEDPANVAAYSYLQKIRQQRIADASRKGELASADSLKNVDQDWSVSPSPTPTAGRNLGGVNVTKADGFNLTTVDLDLNAESNAPSQKIPAFGDVPMLGQEFKNETAIGRVPALPSNEGKSNSKGPNEVQTFQSKNADAAETAELLGANPLLSRSQSILQQQNSPGFGFAGGAAQSPDKSNADNAKPSGTAQTEVPGKVELTGLTPFYRNKSLLFDAKDSTDKNNAIHVEALKLTLNKAIKTRESLASQMAQETVEAKMPKTTMVGTIELADAQPTQGRTLRERLTGKVERKARTRVEPDQTGVAGIDTQNGAPEIQDQQHFISKEIEAIQSPEVLDKVIERLDLQKSWAKKKGANGELSTDETRRMLKQNLDVVANPDSSLVNIGVKSEKPEEAAKIANTISEVYHENRAEKRKELTLAKVGTLNAQLAQQDQKIAQVKQELAALQTPAQVPQTDASIAKAIVPVPEPQPEIQTSENSFSTFSLNVSDVSFKLAAASLEKGVLPDAASIRSEEFINAFDYRDPDPAPGAPIGFAWGRAHYPFAQNRDLVRFSVKTAAAGRQPGRPLNVVLLLDNSGSMERADRVQIIREALRVLAAQLQPQDKLSVVTFARTARLWVDGVSGDQAGAVAEQVGNLTPQGGTNLEEAMKLAYETARRHYLANGINRVVLLTDGAANLGNVEPVALKQKVEENRQQGIALDCFGIGWEGFNDDLLEVLSRNGDGRYGFLNTPEEAATDFAGKLAGALNVAASDVKVQVEFNPKRVTAYRQIGYAKHQLTKEQFRDNTVDAAEIGAAESGNALYVVAVNPAGEGPLGTVRVRFKVPGTADYREHEWALPYTANVMSLEESSPAMRLAATASAFSEWLAGSPFAAEVTPDTLLAYLRNAPQAYGADARPTKLEWMIRQAKSLSGK